MKGYLRDVNSFVETGFRISFNSRNHAGDYGRVTEFYSTPFGNVVMFTQRFVFGSRSLDDKDRQNIRPILGLYQKFCSVDMGWLTSMHGRMEMNDNVDVWDTAAILAQYGPSNAFNRLTGVVAYMNELTAKLQQSDPEKSAAKLSRLRYKLTEKSF